MIEYSDYNSLISILDKSNQDSTYQDLMSKEIKVLDTVNNVVNYYKDVDIKQNEFINKPISQIVYTFFSIWIDMYNELINGKNIMKILFINDRLIYIGITCIIISIFLYYIQISSS